MQTWTVGQLRAELVGVADTTRVVAYVQDTKGAWRLLPLVGAGYGPGVDPTDPVLADTFPLVVAAEGQCPDTPGAARWDP